VTGGFKDAYETATKGTRDYGVRLIEAGRCVVFLAADDAGLITGSTLTANGAVYYLSKSFWPFFR
jgi:hypothetical protein